MTKLAFSLEVERSTERRGACNYAINEPWGGVHVHGARMGSVKSVMDYFKPTLKRLNQRFTGETRGFRWVPRT